VIFAPALKHLGAFVMSQGFSGPIAYYDERYRRDASPLLDELALAIDHVVPYSKKGAHDDSNFVTACSKCNAKKGDRSATAHAQRHPFKPVRGKYGEPRHWDGLASYFFVAGRADPKALTFHERKWLTALEEHFAQPR
jgi:hypothetical protein